jgi:hypothetical protein
MRVPECACVVLVCLALSSPAGGTVVNGEFSAGNTGFATEYTFAVLNGTEGEFTVRSDPQNWNTSFAPTPDHTSGTGPILIVNGATAGNPFFWQQTMAVVPGSDYEFSAWVSSAVGDGPADLLVEINGAALAPSFTAPLITGTWEPFVRSWNSGSTDTATIRLINSNLSVYPNDFYIDDISFAIVPEPSPIAMIAGLALVMCMRRAVGGTLA